MKNTFNRLASVVKYVRLQLNLEQQTVANETGVSLRTIQNIEAGKSVNASSLFAYLDFLGLLQNMLSNLPNPDNLTPMERLKATPKRRQRASQRTKKKNNSNHIKENTTEFNWGDEQ